eukprot:68698-Prorocentrum_minimum.AAC.1
MNSQARPTPTVGDLKMNSQARPTPTVGDLNQNSLAELASPVPAPKTLGPRLVGGCGIFLLRGCDWTDRPEKPNPRTEARSGDRKRTLRAE